MRTIESKPVFELEERWIPKNPQQIFVDNHLTPWANSLLDTKPILDLAGGSGFESERLTQLGYQVALADLSTSLLTSSLHALKVQADAENLPFPHNCFSGIVIKDVWVFLTPTQRRTILLEMKRVLIKGGSILLLSQLSTVIRIHYMPAHSKYPQKSTNSGWDEFLNSYNKLQSQGDSIFSIEYVSSIEDTLKYATEAGFSFLVREEYQFDSPLALENRWVNRAGFIVELSNT